MKIFTMKDKYPTILSIVLLIWIWKIITLKIGNELILPSPENTYKSLLNILQSKDFIKIVFYTIKRGGIGILISAILGLGVGFCIGMYPFMEKMLEPPLAMIQSTPIMSIIILALIWIHTENVPVFVSFLVAFPIICVNVSEGIKNVDQNLIQMASIYEVNLIDLFTEIYLPSIASFFMAGLSNAIGIGFKAVIAAEVLSQPKAGIGTSLYNSKVYIETNLVFAWTLIAIGLSFLFEKILKSLQRKIMRWRI
ncbi:ABC transporter permease [Inediibacterium massiliense]|uniref:ABC transporter permease n=1 Tax=Inediibacterium massiliense TaxID=1658111 RepID=UPI0006B6548A|nr:ABC transporter permease subunit [Inediibacterium massiliense]